MPTASDHPQVIVRPARRQLGVVAAAVALATLVAALPVAAADPLEPSPTAAASEAPASPGPDASAEPGASPSAAASPAPSADAAPTDAAPTDAPTAEPSATPGDPGASAEPVPEATPDVTPGPTPQPTPVPTPQPTPVPTPLPFGRTPVAVGDAVTFFGRGWGHGVGMSQHGARARAAAGQLHPEILAAYYGGTTPGTVDPATPVRVLLLARWSATTTPLAIAGRGGAWSVDGLGTFPADAVLRATRVVTASGVRWTATVTTALGAPLWSGGVGGSLRVRPADAAAHLHLLSKAVSANRYRGTIRALLTSTGATVVNHVALDDYLRGVVPVEMPSAWPAEALAAQAVASRSYAVRRLHPATGSFDLYDDTRTQAYRGLRGETAAGTAAVAATAGVILRAADGTVANTVFHAAGGGWTEHSELVWVTARGTVQSIPVPYLRGVPDRGPDGLAWDAASPWYAWRTTALTRDRLSAMLARDARTSVGALRTIDLSARGVSGRVYRVTLVGSLATRTVSADVFRAVYNLYRPAGTLPLRGNLFDLAPLP